MRRIVLLGLFFLGHVFASTTATVTVDSKGLTTQRLADFTTVSDVHAGRVHIEKLASPRQSPIVRRQHVPTTEGFDVVQQHDSDSRSDDLDGDAADTADTADTYVKPAAGVPQQLEAKDTATGSGESESESESKRESESEGLDDQQELEPLNKNVVEAAATGTSESESERESEGEEVDDERDSKPLNSKVVEDTAGESEKQMKDPTLVTKWAAGAPQQLEAKAAPTFASEHEIEIGNKDDKGDDTDIDEKTEELIRKDMIQKDIDDKKEQFLLEDEIEDAEDRKRTKYSMLVEKDVAEINADGESRGLQAGAGLLETKSAKTRRTSLWSECPTNADGIKTCFCAAFRRRVVVRFKREPDSGWPSVYKAKGENWYWRTYMGTKNKDTGAFYAGTPAHEMNVGFLNLSGPSGAWKKNLQACGGDHPYAKDCVEEPVPCSFQEETDDEKNTYDAKSGQYCCSSEFNYCSYKCVDELDFFECKDASDKHFPGGLDPVGPDIYKKCYMAQYAHGSNPEQSNVAMVEQALDLTRDPDPWPTTTNNETTNNEANDDDNETNETNATAFFS